MGATANPSQPAALPACWRPAVGFAVAFVIAFNFTVPPVLTWLSAVLGHPTVCPQLSLVDLGTLIGAVLTLMGMRTYEKQQGIAS